MAPSSCARRQLDASFWRDADPKLQAAGWQGSVQAVRRYVRPFRQMTAAPPPAPAVPEARQITSWLLRRPGSLDADEQATLAGIRAPVRTRTPWPGT